MSVLELQGSAGVRPRPRALPWPLLTALAAALAAGLAGALATFVVAGERDAAPSDLVWLGSWVSFAVVGALVLAQRPGHRGAQALLGVGTLVPLAGLLDVLTFWAADAQGDDARLVAALRLSQDVLFTAGFALLLCSLLLIPDGVLARRWMRWPARLAFAGAATQVLVAVVAPGPIGEDLPLDNPIGITGAGPVLDVVEGLATLALVIGALVGVVSLVLRARRATGATRAQLAWLAFGVLAFTAANLLIGLLDALDVTVPDDVAAILIALVLPVVPACLAVAVLRHNLLDIELLLRRSLLYAVLSAGVLVAYLGLAALLGSAVDGAGASALLGGVVALAALPLRDRGQRWLERRFYGESGDAYGVLSGLSRQLSEAVAPDEVPQRVARSVVAALRVPWAAVELGSPDEPVLAAAAGSRPAWPPVALPLSVHGTEVGRLLVAPRQAAEPLEERDLRLLRDLAGQVAVAVEGLRLARELQRSREALVLAREEERRRLRNDLHDGLGPVLAGVLLQLGVAREGGVSSDGLAVAEQRLGDAVADLRRLVYGLRPPALDDLGLAGALQEHATSLAGGLELRLDVPETLPPLPAAIEVAAFRVATEGLTNVVRHSGAQRCSVAVLADGDDLIVEVRDDGSGVSGAAGIGITSMRERCAEVGGACEVVAGEPRGTVVRARLPLVVARD